MILFRIITKLKIAIIFLIISILANSCATVFTGTKQNVQINTSPPGAKVLVDGIERGTTPLALRLKKGSEGQVITIKMEGYETKVFQPETDVNFVSVLNLFNLLFWGIDAATGALWKYDPKYYEFELTQKKVESK